MKKLNILILTMIALSGFFVLTFGAPSSWAGTGVDNNNVFELDGNTQNDPALPGLDWGTPFPPNTPLTPNPIQDPAPLTIFTTGGSKDTNDVSQWRHTDGSVPDKDNILQAVAAALALPSGDTAVYFAASRFDNSGNAEIGLWFFQQTVAPQPDGTFGPAPGQFANHVDGDLLVLVNFENGGVVPTIQVFKWQGGVNGGPVLVGGALLTGECGVGPNAGNLDVCAITNVAASNAPGFWGYVPKSGTSGVFPPQTFFEGGVNLSKIFGAGNVPCFSSFLAETRSSSSITATLKDFAEGSFNLCKITVTKNCSSGVVVNGGTALKYTFSGTVTNNGAGTVYDVQVVDTPLNVNGTQNPANPITVAASIAPGASAPWSATFVTKALTFTDQAVARAAPAPGGAKTITDTTTASCQGSVNSSIKITKNCVPGTKLVASGGKVVVQVGVSGTVTNNGNTKLSGITLADNPATTVTLGSSTLNPGASTTWSASYQPAAISSGNGTIPGRYFFDDTIRVTAATPALGPPLSPVAGCPNPADLACAGADCPICPPGSCVTP
jgi:hypothetical protein